MVCELDPDGLLDRALGSNAADFRGSNVHELLRLEQNHNSLVNQKKPVLVYGGFAEWLGLL